MILFVCFLSDCLSDSLFFYNKIYGNLCEWLVILNCDICGNIGEWNYLSFLTERATRISVND